MSKNSSLTPSENNPSTPSNLEKIISTLPDKFRKLLLVLLASQMAIPKDASANTTADQIFASNSDNSTPITTVVEKPDSLTLPTLSPNPKSKIQNSKFLKLCS